MSSSSSRLACFLEALAFSIFVCLYIWKWQTGRPNTWIIFPAWVILSFALHRDTPKTLGWRADNLWPATRRAAKVFGVFIAALVVIGFLLGAEHELPVHLLTPQRFFSYFAFCTLQEVALQSVVMNRMLGAIKKEIPAAVIAGALFSALHWPNPVLVPLTFIGGTAMCWLFGRERNIIPLILGQAILGSLVWWAFPVAWHHGMRVGPGFYLFPPH
jgi:Type II CAAX prenyl endopeptidase Rce1-like